MATLAEALQQNVDDNDYLPEGAVEAWFKLQGAQYLADEDVDDILRSIEDSIMGQFDSDEEFAQTLAEDVGYTHPTEWPYNCIDWAFAARELMYDYNEQDGFYFRA